MQSLNWTIPFSVLLDKEQPAWHDEKYVIPSAPQIGENLSKSHSHEDILHTGANLAGLLESKKNVFGLELVGDGQGRYGFTIRATQ